MWETRQTLVDHQWVRSVYFHSNPSSDSESACPMFCKDLRAGPQCKLSPYNLIRRTHLRTYLCGSHTSIAGTSRFIPLLSDVPRKGGIAFLVDGSHFGMSNIAISIAWSLICLHRFKWEQWECAHCGVGKVYKYIIFPHPISGHISTIWKSSHMGWIQRYWPRHQVQPKLCLRGIRCVEHFVKTVSRWPPRRHKETLTNLVELWWSGWQYSNFYTSLQEVILATFLC